MEAAAPVPPPPTTFPPPLLLLLLLSDKLPSLAVPLLVEPNELNHDLITGMNINAAIRSFRLLYKLEATVKQATVKQQPAMRGI